jgi:hypothetical protein
MKTFKTACFDRPLHCLASKSRSRNTRGSACLGVKTGFNAQFTERSVPVIFSSMTVTEKKWSPLLEEIISLASK